MHDKGTVVVTLQAKFKHISSFPPPCAWCRLNVTAIPNVTALTEPEQAAALAIFDTCCATGTCTRWDEANYAAAAAAGGDTNTTYTDFCNMESNSCTPEGNLVTLDLTGYGLSCDLGSISFSNFTQLEFLILSGNNLTVSDRVAAGAAAAGAGAGASAGSLARGGDGGGALKQSVGQT